MTLLKATALIPAVGILIACGSSTTPAAAHVTVKSVSGGWDYALALKSDGSVWSWGANDNGQLGYGTTSEVDTLVPTAVKSLSRGVTAIAGGWDSAVALKTDGSVWTWGKNDRGQLGNRSFSNSATPDKVAGLPARITAIAAGDAFALALASDGSVWAWGDDYAGELGDGANSDSAVPVRVKELPGKAIAIAAGSGHSLAVLADGSVWAWGANASGELGVQTADVFQNTPVKVRGLTTRAVGVGAGLNHSAAILADGSLWWWGREFVPAGDYMGTDEPAKMRPLSHVKKVLGGWDWFLVLQSDGSVWSWGFNLGDLGDGIGDSSLSDPVRVTALEQGVVDIGIGVEGGYAITAKGVVWSWGTNNHGELGNGTVDPEGGSDTPVVVRF